MYLRNKKTGEVVDWSFVGPTAIKEYEGKDILLERERYESIEEFISEWEDYVPKEPHVELAKKEPRKEESPDLVTWEFIAEELKKMHAPETAELCGEEDE